MDRQMKKLVGEETSVHRDGKDPGISEVEVTLKIIWLCSHPQGPFRQLISCSIASATWIPSATESSLPHKASSLTFGQTPLGTFLFTLPLFTSPFALLNGAPQNKHVPPVLGHCRNLMKVPVHPQSP